MSGGRAIDIDRIALTLDGVTAEDARLLAGGLRAAIEARLAERSGESPDTTDDADAASDAPLVTALCGQALVDAVAARLVAALPLGGSPLSVAALGQENQSWR